MTNKQKALIYTFLSIFLWAFIPVISKLAQNTLDNFQFLFYSSLISFITIFTITLIKKKVSLIFKYTIKEFLYVCIVGFLGTYLYYILLYFGYKNANSFEVLIIQYTWPILIVILSILFFKEKLNRKKSISLFLGFFATILVLSKGDFAQISVSNTSAIFYVFLGALSFALFSVLSKTIKLEALGVVSIYFFIASIFSLIFMIIFSSFIIPNYNDLIYILINGIFLNGITYIFWLNALKLEEGTFLAPFIFITPILSMFYLSIFFDDEFLLIYFIALILIIASALINTSFKKAKNV